MERNTEQNSLYYHYLLKEYVFFSNLNPLFIMIFTFS